ncbi:hypothetical protein [Desulfococcus sp.]|uniref:hypothetical protein n=1 Tax=Desulfococcus sp. TaxID=2025834 RepID=UPI0035940D72
MIAIANVVIFFALLAVSYPAAITVLALVTWLRKRRAMQADDHRELLERIDESTDKLKDQLFIIFIGVTFFVIAPFMALLFMFKGR